MAANPTGYFNTQQTLAQPGTGIIAGAQNATPAPSAAPTPAPTPAPAAPGAAPTPAPSAAPVDYTAALNGLYQKDLNRQGDAAGLDYWKAQLGSGATTLAGVDQLMQSSDEYKRLHPAMPSVSPASATQPSVLGSPAQWAVSADQTAAGQMQRLIDPNSPFYQSWATAGAQDAAARGFTGNGSIRDSAILDSVMRNATPLATADAATYAKAAGYNADMGNQFAVDNANAANQLNLANLSAANQMGMANLSASTQLSLANLSASTQRYVADQGAATQKAVAQMSNDSQKAISSAHDANSLLIQNNQAAANAYAAYVQAVASIDQQPGMDEYAKQTAIVTQTQIFNNAIAGLRGSSPATPDVSSPLDISNIGRTGTGTDPSALAAARAAGVDVTNLLAF